LARIGEVLFAQDPTVVPSEHAPPGTIAP
jgi:hypothetical protein